MIDKCVNKYTEILNQWPSDNPGEQIKTLMKNVTEYLERDDQYNFVTTLAENLIHKSEQPAHINYGLEALCSLYESTNEDFVMNGIQKQIGPIVDMIIESYTGHSDSLSNCVVPRTVGRALVALERVGMEKEQYLEKLHIDKNVNNPFDLHPEIYSDFTRIGKIRIHPAAETTLLSLIGGDRRHTDKNEGKAIDSELSKLFDQQGI